MRIAALRAFPIGGWPGERTANGRYVTYSAKAIEDHHMVLGACGIPLARLSSALSAAAAAPGWQSGSQPVIGLTPVRLVLTDQASCARGWIRPRRGELSRGAGAG